MAQSSLLGFVGTYTAPELGDGKIFAFRFAPDGSSLDIQVAYEGIRNPSFHAIAPAGDCLYSVSEIADFDGGKTGGLTAFRIDGDEGCLTRLNQEPSGGRGPCHVSVSNDGGVALVANYGSGSVASYPILTDGRLGAAASVHQFAGHSINAERQEGPHAHAIKPGPSGNFAFVPDLGTDRVMQFVLEGDAQLSANASPFATATPGSGPRHLVFHPHRPYAYVINELSSTVTTYDFNQETGTLEPRHEVSTLPSGYTEISHCADIHIEPSGRFLYGSNRGHDSIAMFAIGEDGALAPLGFAPSGGQTPRNFVISPCGGYVLVANQDSDNIVVLKRNEDGTLLATGVSAEVPKPVCLTFMPL